MRMLYGKPHEGETGLALAKFIKETFKSILAVRKIEKLSNSSLGRAYIAHAVLNNVDEEKRGLLLQELLKLKDKRGVDFIEGLKKTLESKLSPQEYTNIDTILGRRLAHIISDSKCNVIFDPIDSKLYTLDIEGMPVEKKIDLRNVNDLIELMSYGLLDKKKDLYSEYANGRC